MNNVQQSLLVTCVMIAFAGNSILNRFAIEGGHIDSISFALIRLFTGALILLVLVQPRTVKLKLRDKSGWLSAVGLAIYVLGFSIAYQSLSGAMGALILFFTVQVSMLAFALTQGQRFGFKQVSGIMLACFGFLTLVWESLTFDPDWMIAVMMLAGLGWALFSVVGLRTDQPAIATRNAFIMASFLSLPMIVIAYQSSHFTLIGIFTAALCGSLTSGLGYWLWYRALKYLDAGRAAIWQLTVPVWVAFLGVLVLSEPITGRFFFATVLVIGGLLAYLRSPKKMKA